MKYIEEYLAQPGGRVVVSMAVVIVHPTYNMVGIVFLFDLKVFIYKD